jgi:putative transcriptional regulator
MARVDDASLKGKLLVANPALQDPNFDRTVVLVLEHHDEGAVGVILNRPSETAVEEVLPLWASVAAEPAVVFVGGPVAPGSAIGLGCGPLPSGDGGGFTTVLGAVGVLDLSLEPDELEVGDVRVFSGYAGWSPGQLEGEIEAGGWFVVDALPGDASAVDAIDLWRLVLRRQGGDLALVASFPVDPSLN